MPLTYPYLINSFLAIGVIKLISFYVLKVFRLYLKGNIRNVVIIGKGENVKDLQRMFKQKKGLGYNLIATFSNSEKDSVNGRSIKESFEFLKKSSNSI